MKKVGVQPACAASVDQRYGRQCAEIGHRKPQAVAWPGSRRSPGEDRTRQVAQARQAYADVVNRYEDVDVECAARALHEAGGNPHQSGGHPRSRRHTPSSNNPACPNEEATADQVGHKQRRQGRKDEV